MNRALGSFYIAAGRLAEAEAPLKVYADSAPTHAGKLTLADYYYGVTAYACVLVR